jgi:hypothetical protein
MHAKTLKARKTQNIFFLGMIKIDFIDGINAWLKMY